MARVTGSVGSDGRSATDIHDMAALAGDAELPPELATQLENIMKSELVQPDKAKFKLELYLQEKRSLKEPFGGMLLAWTNGGFAHGGGDEVVYFCPAKTERDGQQVGCGAPLALQYVGKTVVVCPECRQASDPRDLVGQVYAKLDVQGWARMITKFFMKLESNADIRLGIMTGDLHAASQIEAEGEHRGDVLDGGRRKRHFVCYTLESIIKDTAGGADLYTRIKAFLTA